jgi:hypothetical protein
LTSPTLPLSFSKPCVENSRVDLVVSLPPWIVSLSPPHTSLSVVVCTIPFGSTIIPPAQISSLSSISPILEESEVRYALRNRDILSQVQNLHFHDIGEEEDEPILSKRRGHCSHLSKAWERSRREVDFGKQTKIDRTLRAPKSLSGVSKLKLSPLTVGV